MGIMINWGKLHFCHYEGNKRNFALSVVLCPLLVRLGKDKLPIKDKGQQIEQKYVYFLLFIIIPIAWVACVLVSCKIIESHGNSKKARSKSTYAQTSRCRLMQVHSSRNTCADLRVRLARALQLCYCTHVSSSQTGVLKVRLYS